MKQTKMRMDIVNGLQETEVHR